MLIARDGGCTKPGCTIGAYGCQVHHVVAEWADGGNTNVDDNGLACGPDNRSVDKRGGWSTQMNERCEVEWTPPPALDTGQARINYYHRPDRLLHPPEEPEPRGDNRSEPIRPARGEPVGGEPARGEPVGGDTDDDSGHNHSDETEPGETPQNNRDDEPGGPAPPEDRAA